MAYIKKLKAFLRVSCTYFSVRYFQSLAELMVERKILPENIHRAAFALNQSPFMSLLMFSFTLFTFLILFFVNRISTNIDGYAGLAVILLNPSEKSV